MTQQTKAIIFVLIAIFVLSMITLVWIVTQAKTSSSPPPYHQKYYLTLKYDVRHICAYDSANVRYSKENVRRYEYWQNKYLSDERYLEFAGYPVPDYGTLSQYVGAPC